jgi:hypothetical protein
MALRFANATILPREWGYRASKTELRAIWVTTILLVGILVLYHAGFWAYALTSLLPEFANLLLGIYRSRDQR